MADIDIDPFGEHESHIEKFMVCLCRVSVGFVGDSWHAVLQGSMRTLNNVRHDLRARGQTSENLNHESPTQPNPV